jgi:cell division protein FtsW
MRGKSRDKGDKDTASSSAGRGKRSFKSSSDRTSKDGSDSKRSGNAKPSKRGSVVKRIRQSRFMKEPGSIMGPRLLFIASVAVLLTFGLIMVYSASSITAYNDFHDAAYYVKRQAMFMVIGIIACIVCAKIPYRFWCNPTVFVVLWFITVLLLTATAFGLGVSALGAERSIMIAGFALQPAEFAKIVILMTCASLFELWHEGKFEFKHFIGILAVATLVPLILIYRQPDLGTAIILAVGFLALCLLAQVPLKPIAIIIGVLVLYVVFACVTQPYHLERIITMFDPWVDPQGDGYQSVQSLYAFGSGGLFGTGLGLSRQKYLYLPYAHTDFIFAIVGEELGFIGAAALVVIFGVFIFAGIQISRRASDLYGCYIAGSMTVMVGFQACVNMACVCGIAPVTGKALPFISYGGSSLMATMIIVGLILSVSVHTRVDAENEQRRDNLRVLDGGSHLDVDLESSYAGRVISLFGGQAQQQRPRGAAPRPERQDDATTAERRQYRRSERGVDSRYSSRSASGYRSRRDDAPSRSTTGRTTSRAGRLSHQRSGDARGTQGTSRYAGSRRGSRTAQSQSGRTRTTRGGSQSGRSSSSRRRGSFGDTPNRSGRNRGRRR